MKLVPKIDFCPDKIRRLTIEVTTACNLSCTGCQRTIAAAKQQWKTRHMPLETFKHMVEKLPPVELGVLHGIGEPTLHPDFEELCTIAKKSGRFSRLHCNTNALCKDADFYSKLFKNGLSSFSVSVDSLDPFIAERTRTGTDVKLLESRLRSFAERKFNFSVTIVASSLNFEELPETICRLADIGVVNIFIQPFIEFATSGNSLSYNCLRKLDRRLKKIQKENRELIISFSLGAKYNSNDYALCTAPWFDPAINVQGFWTPCCVNMDEKVLGKQNASEKSFCEMWKTPEFTRFISDYVNRSPEFCFGCSENIREAVPSWFRRFFLGKSI